MNTLIVNCDGGSRGNPGPAAGAFVVSENGKQIYSDSKFLGITTNNIAEYEAVILALEWILSNKKDVTVESIKIYLDSELITRQIKGIYKVKNLKLKNLNGKAMSLIQKIDKKIFFENVSREKNKNADRLVNIELDRNP